MPWAYRLVRGTDPDGTVWCAIHEVYFNDAGQPDGVTEDAADILGAGDTEADAVGDCAAIYRMMAEAFNRPVLEYDAFGEKPGTA